ncbi:hypothetical protein B0H17DRAFT_922683 [Mycena rosella]|uniref:GLTSCR protein conserved domain-containing protein n=1 Tax=Mycena rosella TaxID=1033263 RepID=A0AAD7GNP4_MYCRO|nr:hypothetical protein B0H17DRAFT_922683 [Mycena rosella]
MSKAFQSSFPSSSSSGRIDQSYPVPTFSSTSSAASFSVPFVARPPYAAGNGTWKVPANWNLHASNAQPPTKETPKAKKRTTEEEEITKRTASRFVSSAFLIGQVFTLSHSRVAARLAQDHAAVTNPDTETPFSDSIDVVNRLLPYHVFHQPKEDLDRKGKRKADDLATEIEGRFSAPVITASVERLQETKFALECFKRKRTLEERFRRIKTRSGKRPAPDDQAVALAQAVLEADRSETTWLNSELRAARADLDRIQREKRQQNTRLQPPTPVAQPQYYRAYNPFPYAQQAYGQAMTFPTVPPAATPPAASAAYPQYTPNTAIPVQLPVSSLPALHALGIQPVAATSLAPGAAQPPAVLRGSSADGTMLSLEINVSLLQAAQMSGLAIVLNSLMAQQ